MSQAFRGVVEDFRQSVEEAFPLIRQLDIQRCLAEVKGMTPEKKKEWALRSRTALRTCVGIVSHREQRRSLYPSVFGTDAAVHTVLCLTADLLSRMPAALMRAPLPDAPGLERVAVVDSRLEMHLIHVAMYQAEAEQNRDLGIDFA